MPLTRRSLLGLMSSSTFMLSAASGAKPGAEMPEGQPPVNFPQGVASADPTPDAVMLWTRAVPTTTGSHAKLLVQLSTNLEFTDIIVDALLESTEDTDYTVRAFIDGLDPDTIYFYRFIGADNSLSRAGRTRTAPAADQARPVNIAFASCQSFEQAYYGAWARMLADDEAAEEEKQIDFVLHLGDFIYERSWNKREDGSDQSRRLPDFPDGKASEHNRHALSLADYRHLYKIYLSDPHLQAARARWPFVCTWDDHEFSNDNFQSYSTYGKSRTLEAQRKLNANQAWFEFIPALLSDDSSQTTHDFRNAELSGNDRTDNDLARHSLRIYRRLNWGKHLDIVITDTRSYRTPPCLSEGFAESLDLPLNSVELVEIADYGSSYNEGNPPAKLPYGDGKTANPALNRAPGSVLGVRQRDWFLDAITGSSCTWKLWGNSLPLIPMRIDLSALPLAGYEDSLISIDAWSGYPAEVAHLMSNIEMQQTSGVVSLSGDHHLHGAGTISESASNPQAKPVAVDFSCAGISSTPFFESIVAGASRGNPTFRDMVYKTQGDQLEPVWHFTMTHGVLAALAYAKTGVKAIADWLGPNEANPGLKYMDITANGYGLAQFSGDEMRVQLIAMEDIRSPFSVTPAISYKANFRVPRWAPGESPELEGPGFTGPPPFPYEAKAV